MIACSQNISGDFIQVTQNQGFMRAISQGLLFGGRDVQGKAGGISRIDFGFHLHFGRMCLGVSAGFYCVSNLSRLGEHRLKADIGQLAVWHRGSVSL